MQCNTYAHLGLDGGAVHCYIAFGFFAITTH